MFATCRVLLSFVATTLLHVTLFLIMPLTVGGFSPRAILAGYVVATTTASLAFSVLGIGTHVSDLAAFPMPDADGRFSHDWATHQVVTSVDWAPESRLAAMLSGGANAHTAHHLFPGFNHSLAPELARIVIATTQRHGLPYRPTSLVGIIAGHLRHIAEMSRQFIIRPRSASL